MKISAVRGVKDILPEEVWKWQFIESASRRIMENFGFNEIRIPVFEYTELFARSIGQETDIVEKEMYNFQDSKGESLSLRPEGTAGVVRACIDHHRLQPDSVSKLYYTGPMFRHERPQKGRYRQFYQIGAEVFGTDNPWVDAEILSMLHLLFQTLGISDTVLQINSLGCTECRPVYRKALQKFLRNEQASLCTDCRRRTAGNPLRVLDCKRPDCKEATQSAPSVLASLCRNCMAHFEKVKGTLDLMGVPYEVNARLVRGLDYYTRTTFEILTDQLGSQNSVAAGGRYDGLVEQLGGRPTPAIGFALGMERLAALLPEETNHSRPKPLYLAPLGDAAMERVPLLLHKLRARDIPVETDYLGKSLKSQMRQADRIGAAYVGILGEDELNDGVILLRNMETKAQTKVPLEGFVDQIAETMAGEGA
jgi:histidyl-tRNA synthetase